MSDDIPRLKRFRQKGERDYVRAQRAWIIITANVMMRPYGGELITYGELAQYMGYSVRARRTFGPMLGKIGRLCIQNNLPPLNIVVVGKETEEPGPEAVWREDRSIRDEQLAVANFDWFSVRVPTPGTFRRVKP